MIVESIGLGMVASFLMTETIGMAAGGIVVPGYFALSLTEPVRVLSTLSVALLTFLLIKLISRHFLVFGRRMLLLGILTGYLLGYVTRVLPPVSMDGGRVDVGVVGYVVPGLIAYWMHRQGVVETIATLLVAAVMTRLVITVVSGGAF